MDGSEAIAAELQRGLEALLSDEVVREIVRPERPSWIAALLAGLV
jgi:hypothetical protein